MKKVYVIKNRYVDSVTLMGVAVELTELPGVTGAESGMGTSQNVDLLTGLDYPVPAGVTKNDLMIALDAGAEDMKALDDVFEIYTAPNDFSAVREALEQQGLSFLSADVKMIPQNTVSITDEETAAKIEKLLDMLDDNDDVADVYHNAELPESDEEDE